MRNQERVEVSVVHINVLVRTKPSEGKLAVSINYGLFYDDKVSIWDSNPQSRIDLLNLMVM